MGCQTSKKAIRSRLKNSFSAVRQLDMILMSPLTQAAIELYAVRDTFWRPHEETSALSSATCIIIAESAKQIRSACCLCQRSLSRERPSGCGLWSCSRSTWNAYVSAKLFVNDLCLQCCIKAYLSLSTSIIKHFVAIPGG